MPGAQPRFVGLSTGRAGSRYFTKTLNAAGLRTLHEQNLQPPAWSPKNGAVGEVSAHLVVHVEAGGFPEARVWHFSRHPQPFVTSLLRFGFWRMHAPQIHPYLRRTGDDLADSYRYWVDWNERILSVPSHRRTTFRIEDLSRWHLEHLAAQIGAAIDSTKTFPGWTERQDFSPIPDAVAEETRSMMERLGYA